MNTAIADTAQALQRPLCVDLDGTLTKVDTLYDSLMLLVRKNPRALLQLPAWLAGGKANLKAHLTSAVTLDVTRLPYNQALLAYLHHQREQGRIIYLATGANRNLAERAEELLRARERIAQLSAGDRLFVSDEVADYLDELHELGMSQRAVQLERDGWILMQSVSPKAAAVWIADKRNGISDPEFRAIYLEYDAAFDWSPDDPRLYALSDRSQRWFADSTAGREPAGRSIQDPAIVKLIAASSGVSSPAWDRLAMIAKERRAGGVAPGQSRQS